MLKNVLIYPSNGYGAEQVYFCLKESLRYRPIMGNHGSIHAEFITDKCFTSLPLITAPNFLNTLNEFISEHEISFIIPTHDTVADFFAQNQERINACIICSDSSVTRVCRHKRQTYELFRDCSFNPIVYQVGDKIPFPIFAKDDIGQGGKNSCLVYDRHQMEALLKNSEIDYIFTEYLPGNEITVDCFTNGRHELLYIQPRLCETRLAGMSGRARTIPLTGEIAGIAKRLNERLNFRGYWYFQGKQDRTGKYKLMEIATRLAGTFSLTKNLDVNFPLLALTEFDGLEVRIVPNQYDIVSDRAYINRYRINYSFQRVYFDFDDTLVRQRENYIIPSIAFLFQCLNQHKEVILLTRHAHDIRETLQNLHLDINLFRQIIEVAPDKRKSDYIVTDVPAILIDNSFAERMDVKEKCGIPAFDVCNLDCLLEAIY